MINSDDNLDVDQTSEAPIKKPGLSNINVSRPVLYGGLLTALALGIGVFYFTQTPSNPVAAVDPTITTPTTITPTPDPTVTTPANPTTPSRTLEVQQIPLLATTPVTAPTGKPGKPVNSSTATTQVVRPSAPRNVNPFAPLPTSVPNANAFNPVQVAPPSAPLPSVNNSPLPSVAPTSTAPSVVIRKSTPLPPVPGLPGAFAPLKPVPIAVATSKPSVRVPNPATPIAQPARPTVTRPTTTIAAGALPIAPPILQNTTIPRPNPIRPTPAAPPPAVQPSPPPPPPATPTPPSVQPSPTPPSAVTPPPASPPPATPPAVAPAPTPPPATPSAAPPAPPTTPEPATPPVTPTSPATPPVTQVVTPPAPPAAATTPSADLVTLEKYVQDNSLLYQGFVAGTTTQGAFSSSQNAFFLIALGEKFLGSSITLKSADELQAVLSLGNQTLTLKKK